VLLHREGSQVASDIMKRLRAAEEAFSNERLRWVIGRRRIILETGEVDEKRLDETISKIAEDEIKRHLIILELKSSGPLTISEISERTGLPVSEVLNHIIALKWRRAVDVVGEKGDEYLFGVLEG